MILAGTPDGVDVQEYGPTHEGDYYLDGHDIYQAAQCQPMGRWLIVKPAEDWMFMRIFGRSRWEPILIKHRDYLL